MFIKLKLYEWPDDFPEGFARKLLVIASSDMSMDDDMRLLICQLEESIAIPEYLDGPTELYYPGDLRRSTALDAFDQGYNLIIHADHSGVHEIGTAAKNTLWQVMWDSDLATMSNSGEPSILWTLGCDPGWFDGADCFSEAGLLASENTGLVAAISNSRYGMDYQCATYYAFCDALFNTGWIAEQPGPGSLSIHWPLSYLGEAHRCSKNHDNISFLRLNLLGSPLMYVWRDDPGELTIMAPLVWLQEGIPQDITVTVLDGVDPFENATVCLWKKDEIFSVEQTNARGRATFEDVCVADGNHDVLITAVKRRRLISHIGTTVVSYIPDQIAIDVLPSNMPIVLLEGFSVDANGDGTANPGETVDIYLTAKNSGGETAQNVTAELSLVSGGEYIESIPDNQASFPDIAQDQTEDSMDPFTIVVNSNVESYSTVEFNVTFTYYNNNGRFFQWESPLFLTIYSEGYQLTVVEPTAASSGAPPSVITLSNMFLANCGLGEGSNLEITVDNLDPPATYIVNTLTHPGFGSNEVEELSGEIVLNVMASHDGNWFNNFDGCSFDVVVTSEGGEFVSRNVNVGDIWAHQGETLDIPTELQAYEVGQDYISLVWNHSDNVPLEGFYVYYADGYTPYRAFPLPVPVEQATIENLLPGTEYEIQVTAVDIIGRESDPVSDLLSTTCPAVDGWPIQLEGSPGGGAAIADIDQDGSDEIVVATSFGFVYIIERDGSYYTLTPPSGYDFDKFLGCAVGDVDGDSQLEIVVSCQKKIEIEDQEQVAILLFDWNGLFWNVNEITTTEVNEEVYSPYVAGTPVIFQADDTEYLEIALRTRRSGTLGTPHLYVWRYDHNSDSWDNYSTDFPVLLDGSFFNAPTSVDFDEDGYEELIVTTWGSGSVGTALIIVDFEGSGVVSITTHELPDLDYQGIARVFGTLAAATENGEYYITGAATKDAFHKRVFVYTLDTNPVGVTSVWMTEWMNGRDSYSNIPGPSIGDLDGDSYLEVIYTLNGGLDEEEGLVYAWNLVNGNMEFQSDDIPFNPIIGGGHVIKSQPVVGLTTTFDSNAMAVFSGFSSYCCGHDLSNQNSMLTGFPSWTRDGSWAAPAICDLNGDNYAEVLYIDYSGYATLFDWNEGYFTIDGWHIYQDNPHRNGFYNYNESDRQGGLDISVSRSYVIPETRTDSRCYRVIADVDITGISSTPAEESAQEVNSDPRIEAEQDVASVNRSSSSSMTANTSISRILTGSSRAESSAIPSELSTEVVAFRTVEVVAFCGDRVIGSETIPLESGFHRIEIPFRTGSYSHDDIRIVADPFNDYIETDESNNTSTPENIDIVDNVLEVFIPSPAGAIELTLNLPHCISHVLTIRVYSVDGRLVTRHDMEDIQAGRTTFLLTGEREFPTGMYTVCIEGLDTGSIVKKVIILND